MFTPFEIVGNAFVLIAFICICCLPLTPFVAFLPLQLIAMVLTCVAILLRLVVLIICTPVFWMCRVVGSGLRLLPYIALELLVSRFRRTPQPKPDFSQWYGTPPHGKSAGPAPAPPPDPYAQAAALLGLPRDFNEAALKAAYRAAIRKAHPDAGGSAAAAQAVIAAHDLIRQRKGWERKRAA